MHEPVTANPPITRNRECMKPGTVHFAGGAPGVEGGAVGVVAHGDAGAAFAGGVFGGAGV
jgi:hypothetical protein